MWWSAVADEHWEPCPHAGSRCLPGNVVRIISRRCINSSYLFGRHLTGSALKNNDSSWASKKVTVHPRDNSVARPTTATSATVQKNERACLRHVITTECIRSASRSPRTDPVLKLVFFHIPRRRCMSKRSKQTGRLLRLFMVRQPSSDFDCRRHALDEAGAQLSGQPRREPTRRGSCHRPSSRRVYPSSGPSFRPWSLRHRVAWGSLEPESRTQSWPPEAAIGPGSAHRAMDR